MASPLNDHLRCTVPASNGAGPEAAPDVLEVKIMDFINDFLFTNPDACPVAVSPRHRMSKERRYRGMWRFAVRSLMKKRLEVLDLPRSPRKMHRKPSVPALPSPFTFGHSRFKCNASTTGEDGGVRNYPDSTLTTCCGMEAESSAIRQQRGCQAALSNHPTGGRYAVHPVNATCTSCLSNMEGQFTMTCTQPSESETARGGFHTAPAKSVYSIFKPSCKKPPRPPRSSLSHSTSGRFAYVKSARRSMRESTRLRRRKTSASGSKMSSLWAMLVTVCFTTIILVQGFMGRASVNEDHINVVARSNAEAGLLLSSNDSTTNLGHGGVLSQSKGDSIQAQGRATTTTSMDQLEDRSQSSI